MRFRAVLIGALASLLLCGQAFAQVQIGPPWPQTLQPNTVVGNLSPVARPAAGIPIAVLKAQFFAGLTGVNDVAYALVASDVSIAYTAISAARIVTLLPAANFNPGYKLTIFDSSGNATASHTITVAPTGADLINGANASLLAISSAYSGVTLESDGISKWTLITTGFAGLPAIAADSVLGNPTGSSAAPAAMAVANCSFIGYSTSTHAWTCLSVAANTYIGNATSGSAAAAAVAWTSCTGNNSAVQYTNGTGPGCGTHFANLTTADQTVSGGANVTAASLATGNITIDCGTAPLQFVTNGGAFNFTAPANDGSCIVLITNNGSAGAVSFLSFSEGSNTGDGLDTTNGHKFSVSVWRINGTSGYRIAAHQ